MASLEAPEGPVLWHLDISPATEVGTSELQNYEGTNGYCFKPPNFCLLVCNGSHKVLISHHIKTAVPTPGISAFLPCLSLP